ncbi:unnamed protein product [Commensalibacter communis]|uniref:Sel1 repeat family protein n=1 Tax=Commensalibacter communis TaxID=2972786 RepID=A0A9W4TPB6_9PROT|nr:tetratricopeptide repeat protein [Commensalibacter communis]CAI3950575.1 unnamed protein product [Commensalibacter communis]CAI3952503.1 unnamed protein product [Commensalibacter communis]CAI3954543.1 unnamed protein product [Commensalibacter communis]CAI3954675.1 unnamed protein product [Commensalibacter communis]CAI3955092.1 unnamed protein product [Commensalibacter communis]
MNLKYALLAAVGFSCLTSGAFAITPAPQPQPQAITPQTQPLSPQQLEVVKQNAIAGKDLANQPNMTPALLETMKLKASQGDVQAQSILGQVYQHGKYGVKKNLFTARDWYEKAIKQGNVPSMINLGDMYQKGMGVPKSYTKARELFEQAAAKGDAVAQYNLGVMYQNGRGVKKDGQKAIEWYQKASMQGYGDAFNNTGVICEHGIDVSKSKEKAEENYKKACEFKSKQGCINYKRLHDKK